MDIKSELPHGRKYTKKEANYREAENPEQESCYICKFRRPVDAQESTVYCALVDGVIHREDVCDYFQRGGKHA